MGIYENIEWAAAPGTPVIVVQRGSATRATATFQTVKRVTDTQVVLANDARFRRSDGRQIGVGSQWNWKELRKPDDPEILDLLARRSYDSLRYNIEHRFRAAVVHNLADAQLVVSQIQADLEDWSKDQSHKEPE